MIFSSLYGIDLENNAYIWFLMYTKKMSPSKLCFLATLFFAPLTAAHTAGEEEGPNLFVQHLRDAHTWHFATLGHTHFTLHLPIILYKRGGGLFVFSSRRFWSGHELTNYRGFRFDPLKEKISALDGSAVVDLSLTRDVWNMMLSLLILLILFLSMASYYRRRGWEKPPKGGWALMTYLVCFVRDNLAKENIGEKHYERFTPYLLTLFWFIFLNNLLGLLPGAGNVTGNISATLVLALCTFLVTNLNGNRAYWKHIFNPDGVPKWLYPLIIPIELMGLVTKTITLMMRLFANMLAGHLVLLSIINLMFIFKTVWAATIVLPIGLFMLAQKLGIAFLQAYIFTLLSALSIGNAVATHHDEAHDTAKSTSPTT